MDVGLTSICEPSEDVVAREIEGDVIIVPLTVGVADAAAELYTLNETGRAVWHKLNGRRTLSEVATMLAGEFEGSREELLSDVLGFAGEMVARGILSVRS